MKRFTWLITAAVLVAFAAPVLAGDGYKKCTTDAQTCLDHMAAKLSKMGWLGIEMDKEEDAKLYTVTRVVEDSPAAAAGFEVGDVFAGFNGVMLAEASEEQVKEAKQAITIGATVDYVVLRHGHEHKLTATLVEVPEDVMAQWVGGHMLEHVQVASAELND